MATKERGRLWLINIYHTSHMDLVPEIMVLFGDNMQGKGYGGQARHCRDHDNCVGVPTKLLPAKGPGAFFDDGMIVEVGGHVTKPFHKARDRLLRGQDVAYPFSGVGTGRAALEYRAPKIMSLIHAGEKMLKESARDVIRADNLRQVWERKAIEG